MRLKFEGEPLAEADKTSLRAEEAKLKSIEDLLVTRRAYRCLKNLTPEVRTVGDLVKFSKAKLLVNKYFGRKTLNEIIEVLATMGLSLAENDESDIPGAGLSA